MGTPISKKNLKEKREHHDYLKKMCTSDPFTCENRKCIAEKECGLPHVRVSRLLGQDIYEHELVKDSEVSKKAIRLAPTIKEINKVFEFLFFRKYGKRTQVDRGRKK